LSKYKVEMEFDGLPSTEFLTEMLALLHKHEQMSLNTIKLRRILLLKLEVGGEE